VRSPRNGPARERPSLAALGRAIRYLGRWRVSALAAFACLLISTGSMLMVPQLVQNIIDAVVNGLTARRLSAVPAAARAAALAALGWTDEQYTAHLNGGEMALVWAALLIGAFAVARGFFAFSQSYLSERVSQNIAFDFRNELYEKVQRLSFSYHDRTQTGQLMIRATDDVEKVRLFVGQGLLLAAQAVVVLVATLFILFLTNVTLALVALPVLPVALLMFMIFGRISQPLFMEIQVRLSRLNTVLQENLAGIKVVKAFAREPQEQARFASAADALMDQQLRVSRTFSFLFPVVFLIGNLGQAAVLYFGGGQIVGGTLTLGEWQKFSLYLVYVFFPLGQLGFIIAQMSQASASARRVFEILGAQSEVADRPGAVALPAVAGRVEFDHVSLRYLGGEQVLTDVSFVAEPGQTVALLGATGSGKTSIINLIPRFYDVTSGRVLVDGHDVRDVRIEALRARIGIVLQDTTLFSGTIRDNIAFGRPAATETQIIAAARAAAAHDFIEAFPRGYDTDVGERGATLSGGQKQRVAIARALLMDPRILILDDSTSSVDVATEQRIQRALARLMQGRTSFVIAQRISTVRNADLILVLDGGQVAAQGKHEELLEESPIYAEIFNSQLVADADQAGALAGDNRAAGSPVLAGAQQEP
jgi:ATP-binding cassette subfamily B protein